MISLHLRKNEELDHEKLGVFGSENSSAITSSELRSALRETLLNRAAHEINYKADFGAREASYYDAERLGKRNEFWQSRVEKASIRRTKRAKPQSALILAGHGVSLRIHGGALEVKDGLTHFPQQRETYLFFRGDVDLPERIILLDCSGSISFDVLSWLSDQKISLIRINWRGEIVCVAGASGYSANSFRVQWQLETRENPALRIENCRSIISKKIEASILTLEKSIRRSEKWERAISAAYAALTKIDEKSPATITELRALEANCAAAYFRAWQGIPIKWRGTSRRPIPDSWHSIEQRSSPFHLAGNRNAAHPVNAILNYAYTALESELRIGAIAEGYDPPSG